MLEPPEARATDYFGVNATTRDGSETMMSVYSNSESTVGAEVSAKKHLKFIHNIERFCQEVANQRLLWITEVLEFFEIPKESHLRYERARDEASQSRKDRQV